MAAFNISLTPLPHELADKIKWCIDSPKNASQQEGPDLIKKGLLFRGWLLRHEAHPASLVLLDGDSIYPLALNENRPDVIDKLAQQNNGWSNDICCGFKHAIQLSSDSFKICVIYNSDFIRLYDGCINGPFKIVQGRNNWLFLDNDTNKSVEQFTGKIKLSRTVKSHWQHYMSSFVAFTLQQRLSCAFLIAPSKEMVYDDVYPFQKSKLTPAEQVELLTPENFPLLSVQQPFKASEHRTFRVCDTHWSARGAELASLIMCEKLGESRDACAAVFDQDTYVTRLLSGDLGSKVFPPQSHDEDVLTTFNYRKHQIFDNALPNFGRVIVIENARAMTSKLLVLFGSSSAYSMFNYLSRIYCCVIFCHTAGSVDDRLVTLLKPDHLAAQTNARFLVKAPQFGIDLRQIIADKETQVDSNHSQINTEGQTELAKRAKAALLRYIQR